MPYNKRKQKCKQSDGDAGSYVLSYTDKKGKKHRACHTSKKKMQGQIAAIEMEADESDADIIEEAVLRELISNILRKKLKEAKAKSTEKYDDDSALVGDQDKLPDHLQKGIIDKARKSKKEAHHEMDESDAPHLAQYKASPGSKRDKQLDATKADLASGDPKRKSQAYRRRERMERQYREKNESRIRSMVRSLLAEELSKSTEDKIRKKAEERGMTFGSMKAEYKKGLAAWGSSGSRPGIPQHAWAMARINKANPSDDWSVVKKSKAKKK